MIALVDNDVLFKGASYGLLNELVSTVCSDYGMVGVLGSARFVVPKKIQHAELERGPAIALEILKKFLTEAETLEPDDGEQKLAADMELAAQQRGVNLDGGESLLCAILIQRLLPLLVTGDKRAIIAMETLLDTISELTPICGRIKCLEQLFIAALVIHGLAPLRAAVCSEQHVDKALAICFSCKIPSVTGGESAAEGLQSYIKFLRRDASRVLAP